VGTVAGGCNRLLPRCPHAGPAGGGGPPESGEIRSVGRPSNGPGGYCLRSPQPGASIPPYPVVLLGADLRLLRLATASGVARAPRKRLGAIAGDDGAYLDGVLGGRASAPHSRAVSRKRHPAGAAGDYRRPPGIRCY